MDGGILTKDSASDGIKNNQSSRVQITVKGEGRKSLRRATGNRRKQTRKCRSEADMNVPLRLQMGQER